MMGHIVPAPVWIYKERRVQEALASLLPPAWLLGKVTAPTFHVAPS